MSVLIIDQEIRKKIKWVMHYADKHPFSTEDIALITSGATKPAGEILGFRCFIPLHFRVVYTIEKNEDSRLARHISISVQTKDKLPNPFIVLEILKEFGFKRGIEPPNICFIEKEIAINVIELI